MNVANNICVMQKTWDEAEEHKWAPAVVERYNYIRVKTVDTYLTLQQAVDAARELATFSGLPLYVSSKYVGRPETDGLTVL